VKILNKKTTSTALRESMAKEGILIRDCSTFVGLDDSYFRVTVRSAEDNLKLIETLKKALKITD
jgi:threonine-phosphate decarboxylase